MVIRFNSVIKVRGRVELSVFDLLGVNSSHQHTLYTNFHAPITPSYWCILYGACRLEVSPLRVGETLHLFFEAKHWELVLWDAGGDQPFVLQRSAEGVQARQVIDDTESVLEGWRRS